MASFPEPLQSTYQSMKVFCEYKGDKKNAPLLRVEKQNGVQFLTTVNKESITWLGRLLTWLGFGSMSLQNVTKFIYSPEGKSACSQVLREKKFNTNTFLEHLNSKVSSQRSKACFNLTTAKPEEVVFFTENNSNFEIKIKIQTYLENCNPNVDLYQMFQGTNPYREAPCMEKLRADLEDIPDYQFPELALGEECDINTIGQLYLSYIHSERIFNDEEIAQLVEIGEKIDLNNLLKNPEETLTPLKVLLKINPKKQVLLNFLLFLDKRHTISRSLYEQLPNEITKALMSERAFERNGCDFATRNLTKVLVLISKALSFNPHFD